MKPKRWCFRVFTSSPKIMSGVRSKRSGTCRVDVPFSHRRTQARRLRVDTESDRQQDDNRHSRRSVQRCHACSTEQRVHVGAVGLVAFPVPSRDGRARRCTTDDCPEGRMQVRRRSGQPVSSSGKPRHPGGRRVRCCACRRWLRPLRRAARPRRGVDVTARDPVQYLSGGVRALQGQRVCGGDVRSQRLPLAHGDGRPRQPDVADGAERSAKSPASRVGVDSVRVDSAVNA